MQKPKYLAFDTETGGLIALKNPVLTAYFAVVGEDFGIIDELYLFVKPEAPFDVIEPSAMAVNKINLQAHLERSDILTRSEASHKLLEFLKKYQSKRGSNIPTKLKPMGHNVDFDINMVTAQLVSSEDWNKYLHYGKIDTKMIADFLKEVGLLPPEIGRLESLVKHFNIPMLGAHEARNDTLMMIESYRELVSMVSSLKKDTVSFDVLSLLEK